MKKTLLCYKIEYAYFRYVEFVSNGIVNFFDGGQFYTLQTTGISKFKEKLTVKDGNNIIVQSLDDVICEFEDTEELNKLLNDRLILRIKDSKGNIHLIGTHDYPVIAGIEKDLSITQLKFECQRPEFSV